MPIFHYLSNKYKSFFNGRINTRRNTSEVLRQVLNYLGALNIAQILLPIGSRK